MENKLHIDILEMHEDILTLINAFKDFDELFKLDAKKTVIVGISRGGLAIAQYLAYGLNMKNIEAISIQLMEDNYDNLQENHKVFKLDNAKNKIKKIILDNLIISDSDEINLIFVDDLIDTGETYNTINKILDKLEKELPDILLNTIFSALYIKPKSSAMAPDIFHVKKLPEQWVVFPWDDLPKAIEKQKNIS